MTVRVRNTLPHSRPPAPHRSSTSRSMLEHLLAADTATELFGGGRRSGRVAVVRGFDVGGREFRGAIGELADASGLSVLDLPSTPAFGAVPAAEDVRLVVVARSSLLPPAERCAAFWGAPVLGPAVANSLGPVVLRPAPGLQITVSDRAADGVPSRAGNRGRAGRAPGAAAAWGLPDRVASGRIPPDRARVASSPSQLSRSATARIRSAISSR